MTWILIGKYNFQIWPGVFFLGISQKEVYGRDCYLRFETERGNFERRLEIFILIKDSIYMFKIVILKIR